MITLVFPNYGVVVAKSEFERLSGVGVNPSNGQPHDEQATIMCDHYHSPLPDRLQRPVRSISSMPGQNSCQLLQWGGDPTILTKTGDSISTPREDSKQNCLRKLLKYRQNQPGLNFGWN